MTKEATAPQTPSITMLGCGNMGGAMLRAWLSEERTDFVHIIKPSPPDDVLRNDPRVSWSVPEDVTAIDTDILVLGVKPQMIERALAPLKHYISPRTLVVSIAAGKNLAALEKNFTAGQPVVRTMPNTPAAIGKGMTVAVANRAATQAHQDIVSHLLEANGVCSWIEDESLMDSVTAVSGSGPAYIFYMIDVLASAGEKLGLPKDTAMTLARQTVIGAAALAEKDAHSSATTLRENVTSPGGTTEAALSVLMDGKMQEIFDKALEKAKQRGEELSS